MLSSFCWYCEIGPSKVTVLGSDFDDLCHFAVLGVLYIEIQIPPSGARLSMTLTYSYRQRSLRSEPIVIEDTGTEVSIEVNHDLFLVPALIFIVGTLNQSSKSASEIVKVDAAKFGQWARQLQK
jgi:hypothetical protein